MNNDSAFLSAMIKKEKEALISMFLANASIAELAEQYKLIDELNSIVKSASGNRIAFLRTL